MRVKIAEIEETSSLDAVWRAYRRGRSSGSENTLDTPWESTHLGRVTHIRVAVVFMDCGAGVGQRIYIGQYSDTASNLDYFNARYYSPDRGQFVSQDPVFWSSKQNFKDPQSLNAYSYAEDNPISLKDPLGLAATVAQQIAILQAQISILQGIISLFQSGYSQVANTAYTAYQTAFGSGKSEQVSSSPYNSPSKPMSTFPTNYYTPNISSSLQSTMTQNASDPNINAPGYGAAYFAWKVKPHGDWDLKYTSTYSSEKYPSGFIFNGKQITSDAPGNINYGYVGAAAAWASPELLLETAGVVQQVAGSSQPAWQNPYFHGDDPVDQINALWGMSMYYNR